MATKANRGNTTTGIGTSDTAATRQIYVQQQHEQKILWTTVQKDNTNENMEEDHEMHAWKRKRFQQQQKQAHVEEDKFNTQVFGERDKTTDIWTKNTMHP